jgi:hypothetical protein
MESANGRRGIKAVKTGTRVEIGSVKCSVMPHRLAHTMNIWPVNSGPLSMTRVLGQSRSASATHPYTDASSSAWRVRCTIARISANVNGLRTHGTRVCSKNSRVLALRVSPVMNIRGCLKRLSWVNHIE